ncbi:MAG: aldehyde dehydrogenase [Treponema sp.]|jgi:aldehyde dehydrogenase (NAD+)|nr:aldehyde dehydrogenase [Treponema sp.]
MDIAKIVSEQRKFFSSGITRDITYRKNALRLLKTSMLKYEKELNDALKLDLNKAPMESFMTETALVQDEIKYQLRHISKWSRKKHAATTLAQFPSKGIVIPEPYGVVLIMAPWNYPYLLTMDPLIGALAAGNCCILKPSNYSIHVSQVIKKIITDVFEENYIAVIEGGRNENTQLLNQPFDYIFFTGGKTVGRLVLEKAAVNLTPVTLELGGKSPCVITKDTDCRQSAKRLVWGKFLNCGQTCVAPDYVLVDKSIKEELLNDIKYWIEKMFGPQPLQNTEYPKIINEKHFTRIQKYLKDQKIFLGGKSDSHTLKIEPTVVIDPDPGSTLMQEEIFGPLLPVLSYTDIQEAVEFIVNRPAPLALYLFTNDKKIQNFFMTQIPFGGGCINDTVIHLASPSMPFGGTGASGMGSYHGKYSFDTFSREKSIIVRGFSLDLPFRYHPYSTKNKKILQTLM